MSISVVGTVTDDEAVMIPCCIACQKLAQNPGPGCLAKVIRARGRASKPPPEGCLGIGGPLIELSKMFGTDRLEPDFP